MAATSAVSKIRVTTGTSTVAPVVTKQRAPICHLPRKVQGRVMGFLPMSDLLLRCSTVCQDLRGLIERDKALWEDLYKRVQLPGHTYVDVAEDSAVKLRLKTLRLFRAQLNLSCSLFTIRPVHYDNRAVEGRVTVSSKGIHFMHDKKRPWVHIFEYRAGQMRQKESLRLFSSKEYGPGSEGWMSFYLSHDGSIHALSNKFIMKIWEVRAGKWKCQATYPAPITPICLYERLPYGSKIYDENGVLCAFGQLSNEGALVTVKLDDLPEDHDGQDREPTSTVTIWNWNKGQWKGQTLITSEEVSNAQFYPNGELFTTLPASKITLVWRREEGAWEWVKTFRFSDSTITHDKIVRRLPHQHVSLWNSATHREEARFPLAPATTGYKLMKYSENEAFFENYPPDSQASQFVVIYRKVQASWKRMVTLQADVLAYKSERRPAYHDIDNSMDDLYNALCVSGPIYQESVYPLSNGNLLGHGGAQTNALWDMSASQEAVLAQIQEDPLEGGSQALCRVNAAVLKHFLSLPLAITRPIYKMLLERKFPHLLTAPGGFEKCLQVLPSRRDVDSIDIFPPSFVLHYMENSDEEIDKKKLNLALVHLQNDLRETLGVYLRGLRIHPIQIAFELAMADRNDHSSREFYLKKYHALSADQQAVVRKSLEKWEAVDRLNPILWSAEEIAQAFALPINDNPASTAYLLHKFSILPVDFKNAVYGALYKMHRPTKEKDVPRYGEFAFLRQHNFDAINKDRAKAIETALKTLAKIPQ